MKKRSKSIFSFFLKRRCQHHLSTLQQQKKETKLGTAGATSKGIIRDAAGTEGTLSLSSERFNFVNLEESDIVNSIDQASQLFTGLAKKPPTLKEALESMGYEKAES